MPSVCFYFQVHQPYRLRHYSFFDIGHNHMYEDDDANRSIMLKVADKCYLPMNALLLKLIKDHNGKFKVSFSLSGVFMEQMVQYIMMSTQESDFSLGLGAGNVNTGLKDCFLIPPTISR